MNAHTPHPALSRRTQPAHLCQLVRDWTGRIPAGGAIVEEKKDGIRFLWIDGEAVTREGAPIEGVEHIAAVLRTIEHEECEPMFFDGELVVADGFEATVRHLQARGRNGEHGTLWLFDAIPMREWRGRASGLKLQDRRARIDAMIARHAGGPVVAMPWAWAETAEQIEEAGREAIARGAEGVVAKPALATYRRDASTWRRIKRSMTLDLPVIGIIPWSRPDGLGGVVVDHKGVAVTVTAGFTPEQRKALWETRERLLGAIAEVEALDMTARGSLRQARWLRMREDKTA